MDFLQQVYLNNTIGAYIETAVIILLAVVIKRFVSKYATRFMFRMGKGRFSGLSHDELSDALLWPIERFFLILVILIALGRLTFPEILLFKIYKVSSKTIVDSIARFLVIFGFASLLTHSIDFIALVLKKRGQGQKGSEHQLLFFFKDFIKVTIIIFAIVFTIKYALYTDVGKILTGLSIIGAALALAARESLENLIASFVIFFDKPFVTGDTVKIRDVRGAVERIGLRSTRIRTIENSLVTVPNKQMVDNILDNFSTRTLVRNEITMNIPAKYKAETIKNILDEMKVAIAKITGVKEADVFLRDITGDNAVASIVYYHKLSLTIYAANDLRQDVNISLKSVLDDFATRAATEQ